MAGIKEAMKRVMDVRNEGVVVAEGYLTECDCDLIGSKEEAACSKCQETRYIIIRLKKDDGLITQYDDDGDVKIAKNVKVRDCVILMINNNWSAEWQRIDRDCKIGKEETGGSEKAS